MYRIVLTMTAVLAFAATPALAATLEECDAGIQEVSAEVPVDEEIPARKTALSMLEEATTARDAGDYDQCMDYVQQAAGAMRCQYGAGDRLECPTN